MSLRNNSKIKKCKIFVKKLVTKSLNLFPSSVLRFSNDPTSSLFSGNFLGTIQEGRSIKICIFVCFPLPCSDIHSVFTIQKWRLLKILETFPRNCGRTFFLDGALTSSNQCLNVSYTKTGK